MTNRNPKAIDAAEVERRFTYYPPATREIADKHSDVRAAFMHFGKELAEALPESREKSLAFTALEEAQFWTHAAIARPR